MNESMVCSFLSFKVLFVNCVTVIFSLLYQCFLNKSLLQRSVTHDITSSYYIMFVGYVWSILISIFIIFYYYK